MIATTGAQLLPSNSLRALRTKLLPLATVLTPNVPEAQALINDVFFENSGGDDNPKNYVRSIRRVEDLEFVGRAVHELGPKWVLIKGGHCPFRKDGVAATTDAEREVVVDVLVGPGGELVRVQNPYQDSRNTHGTGCSLACEFCLLTPENYSPFPPSRNLRSLVIFRVRKEVDRSLSTAIY